MANNKRKDFGIDSFINEVKEEQLSGKSKAVATEQSKSALGRPSRTNTLLQRKLAKLVYLDAETDQELKMIKVMNNYDYKEIIFTAVREFVDLHFQNGKLDDDGCGKVDKVIENYKVRE